ncbi:MAG TPA: hypothetical protein VKF41_03595 [Bryobacteraceae bacterium]|nr:hypothetical protein [Bryobacteraceae bacterium]
MNLPDLKRIAYFNGQRLTAGDLTDAQDLTRELRWLHNRGLHGWGIAGGFDVRGSVGSRAVTVSPGYGVDSLGREIVLGAPAVVAVPASFAGSAEAQFYLVASWTSDADEPVLQTAAGVCSGGGAVRLSDDPLLAWRARQDLQPGLELVLAQVSVANSRISQAISTSARRSALPPQQPYIASGQAAAATLTWTAWLAEQEVIGLQADVDTSAVRFGATPQYFAQLEGERYLAAPPGPLLAVGFAAAANPTPNGFTFQVLLPPGPDSVNPPAVRDPKTAVEIAKLLAWQVVWMGVED